MKIYATDIDEDALDEARLATYDAKETERSRPSSASATSSVRTSGSSSARTCAGP